MSAEEVLGFAAYLAVGVVVAVVMLRAEAKRHPNSTEGPVSLGGVFLLIAVFWPGAVGFGLLWLLGLGVKRWVTS